MTIRIADELRGSWSTFWATTFTFDVSTFEGLRAAPCRQWFARGHGAR